MLRIEIVIFMFTQGVRKMSTVVIKNIKVVNKHAEPSVADVFIVDGKIVEITAASTKDAEVIIDGSNKILMPGFIDMHIHGAHGYDAMDATQEALHGIASALPSEGVTGFLATTMTQSEEHIAQALQAIGEFTTAPDEAILLGIHLEGPFISPQRVGAQPKQYILAPSYEQIMAWQALSGQCIKEITIAPEEGDGMAVIKKLVGEIPVISIGHSDATIAQTEEAIACGVNQATHLYNQMRPFHHREPGVVGAVLLAPNFRVELIADFVHSSPEAVKFAYALKGADNIILITDAMRAKGLAFGKYELGGQPVWLDETGARLENHALAGSVVTLDVAMRNMHKATNCTLSELVAMTSSNACEQLGLTTKGKIAVGYDADLVMLDSSLQVCKTLINGKIIFTGNN